MGGFGVMRKNSGVAPLFPCLEHENLALYLVLLPYFISGHSPSILVFPKGLSKKKSSFRFTNYVADKSEFLEVVKGVWKKEIIGCNMYIVELKQRLFEIQSKLDGDPFNKNLKESSLQISKEYTEASEDELKLLHQKAKINWLKEVDGEKDPEQFVNHFQNFLGKSQLVQPLNNMLEYVQAKLSEEEALAMIAMVTDDEIKAALFDIDSSKAAGPDGYTSCFFKKAWSCIGNDICLAVKDFFSEWKDSWGS
ncbi:hypothetical protein Tco_0840888 [Tanacetum coccineum]|uniref:RNA-directed DNA polymerase, eukaryota, reverse transcriptase zinc-binding domain protein n=1 Tax=Tanacetum coccineum TaxID=301880 RepID=A0ABQ5AUV0_9ASTR